MTRLNELQTSVPGSLPQHVGKMQLQDFKRCLELRFFVDDAEFPKIFVRLSSGPLILSLLMTDVRSANLPNASPNIWLDELEVEDARGRGMEGIRYIVQTDMGESRAFCCCGGIQIVSIESAVS